MTADSDSPQAPARKVRPRKGGLWPWLHRMGAPATFFAASQRWLPWLWALAIIALAAGSIWGLAFAPADYQQGNSFRIIYVHVPAAILAQSCFMLLAVCALLFLVWKIKLADMVATAAAPVGALMTALALFSGSVWGIPTWGTWWIWDARLTSMLIQLFLYLGVIVLRGSFASRDSGSRAASILALVGMVNIPIIKYSVDWWSTLHQPATFTLSEAPPMPASMWIPLLMMVIGFYALFGALVLMRTRVEVLRRESRKQWVCDLLSPSARARPDAAVVATEGDKP